MADYSMPERLTPQEEAARAREALLKQRLESAEHPSRTKFVRYLSGAETIREAALVSDDEERKVLVNLAAHIEGDDVVLEVPESIVREFVDSALREVGLQFIEAGESQPEQAIDVSAINAIANSDRDGQFMLLGGRVWVEKNVRTGRLIVFADQFVRNRIGRLATQNLRARVITPLKDFDMREW